MTTIVPPPLPPPLPLGPAPPATVTVANPPAALVALAPGARIEGVVVGQGTDGQLHIQTAIGLLTVLTRIPLPPGAVLVLHLQSVRPQVLLQLATVDGRPPLPFRRAPAVPAVSGPPPAAAVAAAVARGAGKLPATLAVGTTLTATLLRASPGAAGPGPGRSGAPTAAPPPGGSTAAAGAPAAGPAIGAPLAATGKPGAAPAGPVAPSAAPAPGRPAAAAPAVSGRGAAAAPAALAPGTRVEVRIVSLAAPGTAAPAVAPPAPGASGLALGTTFAATVTGTTTLGHPIVRAAAGTLVLNASAPLPLDTAVALEVVGSAVPPSPAAATRLGEALVGSRDWPALSEAVAVLYQADPAAALHLVNTVIPRPDSQLAANILFFLSALRGGDVVGWIGEGLGEALRRVRPDLLARLGDEFRRLGRAAEEPVAGDWRLLVVPFHAGEEIRPIRLYVRRRGDDGKAADEEAAKAGTRFVVDLELSRLGRLQLDGLVRGGHHRFDLIVRSARALPSPMRDDIRQIFQEACELSGLKGGASFQTAPPNFVEVTPKAAGRDSLGLVV